MKTGKPEKPKMPKMDFGRVCPLQWYADNGFYWFIRFYRFIRFIWFTSLQTPGVFSLFQGESRYAQGQFFTAMENLPEFRRSCKPGTSHGCKSLETNSLSIKAGNWVVFNREPANHYLADNKSYQSQNQGRTRQ